MCDHLCCKDAVSPLLDTFANSLCHSFLVPPASPASPYSILPCLSTLQAFSASLPLFICCLSTFLACQLGRREGFFLVWFHHVVRCCYSWHTKGLCCGARLMERLGERRKDSFVLWLPTSIACGNFIFLMPLPNWLVEIS